jgi:hypothetical protein
MPVYTAEPSAEERAAAAALLETAARGVSAAAVESVPAPRPASPVERVSA